MVTEQTRPTVLVTGGAGYIGSHAVLALHDAGWPVVVIDDLSNGRREAIPQGVPFHQADIADKAAIEPFLREQQVGAIMHFAGSIVVIAAGATVRAYDRAEASGRSRCRTRR